jgi:hypothetical protein
MLGERLHPLIERSQPELAGKITAMLLLEMESSELLLLLDSQEQLQERIGEALKALGEAEKRPRPAKKIYKRGASQRSEPAAELSHHCGPGEPAQGREPDEHQPHGPVARRGPVPDEPEALGPRLPMAEFDEVAVHDWVRSVPGLTAVHLATIADRMAEDEYEGAELVGCTAKMLRKLLRGSDAEDAVPLLLAARDEQLAAENEADTAVIAADHAAAVAAATRTANAEAAAKAEEAAAKSAAATRWHAAAAMKAMEAAMDAAAKAAPSCGVCFEPYREAVMPRMLACGHTFCEECLSKMLRCAIQRLQFTARLRKLVFLQPLTWFAREQAADGQERGEAAGVPEVPQAVRRQGRARGRAANQLRQHGRLTV